jgi:predicted Zn-dependent protease
MNLHKPLLLLSLLALAGCATTPTDGSRQKVVVPTGVSQVYSEVDLQMKLATAAAPSAEMNEDPCLLFEYQRHVRKLGDELAVTAMRLYPGLTERDIKFRFDVAPSAYAGVLSNAGGTVVVLQGSQDVLPDAALVFLLAREMGHVVARHHDENSAATVMFSVLTQVLFPAAALVKGLAAVLPSTAAGTAATATAVSYLGATALKTTYREDHLREAEQIAFVLMAESGLDLYDIAEGTRGVVVNSGEDTWLQEMRSSLQQLDQMAYGPRRRPFRIELRRTAAPAQASAAAALSGPRNQ